MIRLAGFVLIGLAASGFADQYHNVNQIIGDRAIGLAGAYAGIADDPAGMVYNPAGIAFSDAASMSANVNTLQFSRIRYADVLNGEFDYNREAYQVLPNFFGVVQPLGDWTVGFSNAIIDSTQEKQDQSFEDFGVIDRYVVNLNNLATTYNVGPSIARRLNSQFAIGLSLPLHYRSTEFISNQHIDFAASQSDVLEWSNVVVKTTEQGIRPKLGISWSPKPKFSVGMTVDKTWVISASQTEQISQCKTNTTEVGCATQLNPEINAYSDIPVYPWAFRLGGAWFPNNALLVSADAIYHTAVEQSSAYFDDRTATLDAAVGMEWYWSPRWALRTGAYTAFANTEELTLTGLAQKPHVDRYGATASVARFNKGSSISAGVIGYYGVGKSQLFADLAGVLQDTQSFNVTAFFTTSYRY